MSSTVNTHATATLTVRMVPLASTGARCGQATAAATPIVEVDLKPLQSKVAWRVRLKDLMQGSACRPDTCFASLALNYYLLPPAPEKGKPGMQEAPIHSAEAVGDAGSAFAPEIFPPQAHTVSDMVRPASQVTDMGGGISKDHRPHLHGTSHEVEVEIPPMWWHELCTSIAPTAPRAASEVDVAAEGCPGHVEAPVWFTAFKHMSHPEPAQLDLLDWEQRSHTEFCFTLRSESVQLMIVLESNLPGHFSDNMVTLDPCVPRPLCFTYKGDDCIDVEDLKKSLSWNSLKVLH